MKPTLLILLLALAAFTLRASAGAEDTAAPPVKPSYMLRVGETTLAILADNPMEITASQAIRESETVQRLKGAKIVVTARGHAPVTITGDDLTLVKQK